MTPTWHHARASTAHDVLVVLCNQGKPADTLTRAQVEDVLSALALLLGTPNRAMALAALGLGR